MFQYLSVVHNPNLVKLTDFGLARLLDVGQSFIAADGGQKVMFERIAYLYCMATTYRCLLVHVEGRITAVPVHMLLVPMNIGEEEKLDAVWSV